MRAEAIDVFGRSDKIAELICGCFVRNRKLKNDAVDGWIGIGGLDFGGNIGNIGSVVVLYGHADVGAIAELKIDIFNYDGVVTVANNKKLGLMRQTGDLMRLAFFDKPG